MLLQNRISRVDRIKSVEISNINEEPINDVQRRRFFVKVAAQSGNLHLAALVYTVAYCTVRHRNKHGIVFTAEKVGHQIGLKVRQTQALFRRAIKEKWISAQRAPCGWLASVKVEWHRELYIDSAWDHFSVPEAARLRSISAAMVMDYIDPPPKEVMFGEEPDRREEWQSKMDVEGVMRLMPWLSRTQAWTILEKLTHPNHGYLVKRREDGIYYYKLLKSRHDV